MVLGYLGHVALQPYYRIVKEKDQDRMQFVRYTPYDLKAMGPAYVKKAEKHPLINKAIRFLSRSPKPDKITLIDITPYEAENRIGTRAKKKQYHESREKLEIMREQYQKIAEEEAKKGINVRTIRTGKKEN